MAHAPTSLVRHTPPRNEAKLVDTMYGCGSRREGDFRDYAGYCAAASARRTRSA